MNAEEFVDAVRTSVMFGSVDGTIALLTEPPGRNPAPELLAISRWYLALGAHDRDMLRRALAVASHGAVFGVFAVLDGARRIDDEERAAEFQLWYDGAKGRQLLSGDLHDLLNSQPWYL
jgi:hypothetical protein